MHCSIRAKLLFIPLLLNTISYCSQQEPEMRMIPWQPPVDFSLQHKAKAHKKKFEVKSQKASSKQRGALIPAGNAVARLKLAGGVELEDQLLRYLNAQAAQHKENRETALVVYDEQQAALGSQLLALAEMKSAHEHGGMIWVQPRVRDEYFIESNLRAFLSDSNVCLAAQIARLKVAIKASIACGDKALGEVEGLYEMRKLPVSEPIDNEDTGLHLACQAGCLRISQFFMGRNADVNARGKNKKSPLMAAAEADANKVVHELLEDGRVELNLRDEDGQTALFKAVGRGNREIVNELLIKGADVLIADKKLQTPAAFAHARLKPLVQKHGSDYDSDREDDDILKLQAYQAIAVHLEKREKSQLLKLFKAPATRKRTSLMKEVERGTVEQVYACVEKKPFAINMQDAKGETALMKCVRRGEWQILKVLLDAHASVLIADDGGKRCLDLAKEHLEQYSEDYDKYIALQASDAKDEKVKKEEATVSQSEMHNHINRVQCYKDMITLLQGAQAKQEKIIQEKDADADLIENLGVVIVPLRDSNTGISNNGGTEEYEPPVTRNTVMKSITACLKGFLNSMVG